LKTPRPHELGGEFGEPVIVETYEQGSLINVTVLITANHLGHFEFDICSLDGQSETENCFQTINFTDQTSNLSLASGDVGYFDLELELPQDLICMHCVLRWTYVTGNSWGICEDGNGSLGE
jgi:hypothetical protein